MIPVHVALVDDTGQVAGDLPALAGALNEQIQADFAPEWKVAATVGAYPASKVPAGCWAVRIREKLDDPSALGYHTDQNRQPYALVELTPDYTVTVSHETLEMLADPFGSRLHTADLPAGLESHHAEFGLETAHSRVRYLLEVCDPPEARSYQVGGHRLSDFLLRSWYRTTPPPAGACSHAQGCVLPRQVADGGYVSFAAPDNRWFQVFNEAGQLQVTSLGTFSGEHATLREWTDAKAREHRGDRPGSG